MSNMRVINGDLCLFLCFLLPRTYFWNSIPYPNDLFYIHHTKKYFGIIINAIFYENFINVDTKRKPRFWSKILLVCYFLIM